MTDTLQDRLTADKGISFPNFSKRYRVGPKHKALRWRSEDPRWEVEGEVSRPLPDGTNETFVVLSQPKETAETPSEESPGLSVVQKVKELIRGKRNTPRD